MKIKMIDLLNKIANNEEVPKKIRYFGQIYEYSEEMKFYYQNRFSMYRDFYAEGNCLNDEVEIIEEDKKIEFLRTTTNDKVLVEFKDKINEVIDALNKLKVDD